MKPGDLVWCQMQGFNCGHSTGMDGLGLVISLHYSPQSGKSHDTAMVLSQRSGKIEECWRTQVGHVEEKTDECW